MGSLKYVPFLDYNVTIELLLSLETENKRAKRFPEVFMNENQKCLQYQIECCQYMIIQSTQLRSKNARQIFKMT